MKLFWSVENITIIISEVVRNIIIVIIVTIITVIVDCAVFADSRTVFSYCCSANIRRRFTRRGTRCVELVRSGGFSGGLVG